MIIDVLYAEEQDSERMMVAVNITEGGETKKIAYIIPREALEWRIAEYGLADDDVDTVLDMVLFDPHVQVPKGSGLYETDTVEQARDVFLGLVRAKRQESDAERDKGGAVARSIAGDQKSARQQMRDLFHHNPEVISVKREMVAVARQQEMASKSRVAAAPARDRVAEARMALEALKNKAPEKGDKNAAHADIQARPGKS